MKACVAFGAVAAMVLPGVASAASDRGTGRDRGGHVVPCSLDGVNPAYHPDIFGDPAVARSFGFVIGPDRSWHVSAGCSSSARYRY
ncbi:MAG TPA: hypothetical protein VGI22_22715 [Xanthobacteraceae bacterium]|jgi:hypothetical protein